MSAQNNANAAQRIQPGPIKSQVGAFQGLLVALLALAIAAVAVVLFSIIQPGVPCEFKPVTYAIFTGIVLAAVGAALGGQAVANFSSRGIRATVTGGAAFLLIAMGAVWFVTRTDCNVVPTLRLLSIPGEYSVSRSEPSESPAHLRVEFDPNVRISERIDSDLEYGIFYLPDGTRNLSIHLDLIQGNKSVQVCSIDIKAAPPSLQNSSILDSNQMIALDRDDRGAFELKFRRDFVQEVLTKYDFKGKYDPGSNACIQVDFLDTASGHVKPALVNEIWLIEPGMAERVEGVDFRKGDLSSLLGGFKLYAVRAPQVPNAVSDVRNNIPVPPPVATAHPPDAPGAACVPSISPDPTPVALANLEQTGVVSNDDIKSLFEHWCEVEAEFYNALKSSTDATLRYRLIRFIRTSTTAIDTCWASNDNYRLRNATSSSCPQRLDRPRNFSRPLPFASTTNEKAVIVGLLNDESLQVRHEVEILLRLYPHDDFAAIFDGLIAAPGANPAQTIAPAAVSYYYNRIVEQGWAASIDMASGIGPELAHGVTWVAKLAVKDQAVARARLFYAKANALVQITGNNAPSSDTANQIRMSFSELLNLPRDDMTAYPYPHHLARALGFVKGTFEEGRHFDTYNIDGFEHISPPETATVGATDYESSAWVLPDLSSTRIRQLSPGEAVRIIMTMGGDPAAWQFVSTSTGLAWIKPKTLQN